MDSSKVFKYVCVSRLKYLLRLFDAINFVVSILMSDLAEFGGAVCPRPVMVHGGLAVTDAVGLEGQHSGDGAVDGPSLPPVNVRLGCAVLQTAASLLVRLLR